MSRKRKKNKKKYLTIFFIPVFALLLIVFIYYKTSNYSVSLKDDLTIEINKEFNINDYVKKIDNGTIKSVSKVDTSELGDSIVYLKIENKYKIVSRYTFKIKVIDTSAPTINCKDTIEVFKGSNVNLLDGVEVIDNSNETIEPKLDGEYNLNKEGNYNLSYTAVDKSGNKTKKDFILKVKSNTDEISSTTFKTKNGHIGKIVNGLTYIDDYLIVNKTYSLPKNYGSSLTKETQEAFNIMKNDAGILGLNIYISSGFRSYNSQKIIYNNYVSRDGQINADTYSARPGHSEHQTGLAFDLNSISSSFANTKEGKWVNENCYKYGFIIRYIKGKEDITGYMYEPWHLRYVGEELALKLYNNGDWISMEEYFGITSKYQ